MAELHSTVQVYPRGVQLHLGSPTQPHLQDTLVMSNLGYFQLKSAPGAWTLQLAPGRSRDLYRIQSSTGTLGDPKEAESLVSQPLVLQNPSGSTIGRLAPWICRGLGNLGKPVPWDQSGAGRVGLLDL